MAIVNASNLQYILNSTPIAGWSVAYGLDSSFLFGVVPGGLTPKPGNFQWNAKTSGHTVLAFSESQDLTSATATGKDRVTGNVRRYATTVGIDGLVETKAAGAAYDQLSDILMEEVADGVEDIIDGINYDCITSGSGVKVEGITYYVSTGSGLTGIHSQSYAVNPAYCDKTRYNYYSSYIVSAQTASLALSHLDSVHKGLLDERHSNYNELWTSETQLKKIEDLMSLTGSINYINAQTADSRFGFVQYAGRTIRAIPGYQTDRIDFVRTQDWAFWYSPQVSKDNIGREVRGPFKVEQLARTADETKYSIIVYGNLICKNPFKQGAITNLAT